MPDQKQVNIADIQGLISILVDATTHITDLTEEVSQQIIHPPYLPSSAIQHLISGISGIVYKSIRGTTKLIGRGITGSLAQLDAARSTGISFDQKEGLISVLNGITGDYLNKNNNPLAISMQFKLQGKTLSLEPKAILENDPNVNGKILLMVHGLCMDDLQWNRKEHNHGELLAKELHLSPVYLKYNSGLHISENGQHFSALLEKLAEAWPVPIEEITILAHSMGGLVSRSAYHYGCMENKTWTKQLKKIIFLGTPHQGAPLEKVGNHVDHLLEAIYYTKPFAKLGKIRSAGITDLRLSQLVEEDWKDQDRFKDEAKQATHIPLPETVNCYAIAASIQDKEATFSFDSLGDGLVPVKSALGEQESTAKSLLFKPTNTAIFYQTNHLDLLNSLEVYQQLKKYLAL